MHTHLSLCTYTLLHLPLALPPPPGTGARPDLSGINPENIKRFKLCVYFGGHSPREALTLPIFISDHTFTSVGAALSKHYTHTLKTKSELNICLGS